MSSGSPVILCWTGGWDSTFRLLQLLHDTEAKIQPLYLVDEKRGSTPREIDVMRDIRSDLEEEGPKARERLLPTDYGSYRATTMEPHHKQQWEALKTRGRVGLQYPVLASFAEQNGIHQMELSIEATTGSANILKPVVRRKDTPAGSVYVLTPGVEGAEGLYERFAFPLLDYTKLDMKEEAERRGWMPIMRRTWFCFNPVLGFPCGKCTPCRIARKEGMDSRVGWFGPFLSMAQQFYRRLEKYPRRFVSKFVANSS